MSTVRRHYANEAAEAIALLADEIREEAAAIRPFDKAAALHFEKMAARLMRQARDVEVTDKHSKRLRHVAKKVAKTVVADYQAANPVKNPTPLEKLQADEKQWLHFFNDAKNGKYAAEHGFNEDDD